MLVKNVLAHKNWQRRGQSGINNVIHAMSTLRIRNILLGSRRKQ